MDALDGYAASFQIFNLRLNDNLQTSLSHNKKKWQPITHFYVSGRHCFQVQEEVVELIVGAPLLTVILLLYFQSNTDVQVHKYP